MTIEAIKQAIRELPEDELHSLATWITDREYDAWDRQMCEDFSPGGRGAGLAAQVRQQIAEGRSTALARNA